MASENWCSTTGWALKAIMLSELLVKRLSKMWFSLCGFVTIGKSGDKNNNYYYCENYEKNF